MPTPSSSALPTRDRPAPHGTPPTGERTAVETLEGLRDVLSARVSDVPDALSAFIASDLPHTGLLILSEEDATQPLTQRTHGPDGARATLRELLDIRGDRAPGDIARGEHAIGGTRHQVWSCTADSGSLLVLLDPAAIGDERLILTVWQIVALRLQSIAREASPRFLHDSRTAAALRSELVDEFTDLHSTALESMLAALRAKHLDDGAARQTATRLAADALVDLRTSTDHMRTLGEEPVTTAFQRLRDDLRPLVRYRDLDVQFIEPPVNGRALPSEIAHGARAVVRGAVLALIDQSVVTRVRVKWDCDGTNLLIEVRDDGPGDLTLDGALLQPLQHRVMAMRGHVALATTESWGSVLSVVIPLDAPAIHSPRAALPSLGAREGEVLALMVAGCRNRTIAERLGISENTVKFHVSKIFRKWGATSRAEVIALALEGSAP